MGDCVCPSGQYLRDGVTGLTPQEARTSLNQSESMVVIRITCLTMGSFYQDFANLPTAPAAGLLFIIAKLSNNSQSKVRAPLMDRKAGGATVV